MDKKGGQSEPTLISRGGREGKKKLLNLKMEKCPILFGFKEVGLGFGLLNFATSF